MAVFILFYLLINALLGVRNQNKAKHTFCERREENRDIGATAKGYHRLQQQQNRLCPFFEGI